MNNITLILDKNTGELLDAKVHIESLVELNELPMAIQVGGKWYKTNVAGDPEVLIKGVPFFTCSVQKVEW